MARTDSSHQNIRRIPKHVILPFGYRIIVKQLTNKEMDDLAEDADGLWDVEDRTIFIRKSLPIKRRRYILMHELGHGWLDFTHQFMDEGQAVN